MTFQETYKLLVFIILLGAVDATDLFASTQSPLNSQFTESTRSDTTSKEFTRYRSKKSVGGHILALPSTLFNWAMRPVGFTFKKAEKNLPRLFQGDRGDYGVFPLFELGGDTGYSYGLLLFHNRPFYPNHSARVEALFSSRDYNDINFEYTIDRFLSDRGQLNFESTYANRPERTFLFGNNADFDDRSFYDRRDVEVALNYSYSLTDRLLLQFNSDYLRREIGLSDRQLDQEVPTFPGDQLGINSLLSSGFLITIDNARGVPRINRGSRLITGLQWGHSLIDDQFNYISYSAEWNQFLPLPFLPDNRRLALKGELRKAEPLAEKEIPFFENPSLGSSRDLRGFQTNRFRDSGSLLFTLEYRYPIWEISDMVLFMDQGQVFNRYSDIGISDFHASYGVGIHLISSKGFAFRSELAFSRETSRFILLISPNF
jgi:outer membrane protein assembly factor BamA